MTLKNQLGRGVLLLFVLFLTLVWPVAGAQEAPTVGTFLGAVQPGALVPGTDRFGPLRAQPPVVPALKGDEVLGYVYLTSQFVKTNGYSGKPIHTLVGLDKDGTIVGLHLAAHDEPIVLIGIPERRIVDAMQAFIGYNPLKAAAEGRGPPQADLVSGATVTALVIGEAIVRSAVRVARLLGLGGAAAASAAPGPARVLDPQAGTVEDWSALLADGSVRQLQLTVGEVNQAFVDSGNAEAAKRPQAGAADEPFIDLYVAQVSQPAIGRSLLGEAEYEAVAGMLAPGQQAILVAGDGLYSFKGSGYVRGGIFDRIELVQGAETVRFTDRLHRRVGALHAEGAPDLAEVDVFVVPPDAEFDATAPWRLQLLVQRPIGALDKAFVSFGLPYELPQKYTQASAAAAGPVVPAQAGAVPASELGAEPGAALDGTPNALDRLEQVPLWQRIWKSRVAAIVVLGLMLVALTAIFFFQTWFVKRERLFDRVRIAFLAVTLIWLGWVAGAQLSVVNVLTFLTALREGFHWESFLVDPLIFILWASVAAALLFWGRGPFCGWLCPFGALQELSNKLAKALKLPQVKVPWGVHERLVPIKYILFLGLFGVSLGSLAVAEMLAEVEPFKTAIVLHFVRPAWFVAFALAMLLPGLFIERFYCRYLCPLGAALAIPGRMRMFDWLRRYRECGNPCQRCFHECPVEAIHPEGHINPNECISCLHCQVLYYHDRKCPVMIQRRLKREKREALRAQEATTAPVLQVHRLKSDPTG
ncbi:MAG TPA: 4Fe-4S binding protein [Ottowia sp.]|uniref:4Fe-4S binding protein n=1 Tax=Ottowia sp. TaxID=1898956 RepID=UPI002BF24767|nr:4Fe-4S binding protein [Ottowia sp.]HMN21216.1 4Fe-4S binding protein [Ottowia sp.]